MDIVSIIYFLIPAAISNMMPVFVKNHFKFLDYPLDFNKKWNKKRILGDHKTFRGVIFAVIGAIIVGIIQGILHDNYLFNAISLINYKEINIISFGILIGIAVMFGDALGSFVKRRMRVKPGETLPIIDQIGSAIGIGIIVLPIYYSSIRLFVYLTIIWVLGHFFIKYVGYLLKIDEKAV